MRRWFETESAISGSSSSSVVPGSSDGKFCFEHRQHHLAVTGQLEKLHHLRLVLEELQLHARIVLFGVEQEHLAFFDIAAIQPVNVALRLFPAQRIVDRMQQRRFSRAVLACQHDKRMRQIHDHRHVEVEIRENGMRKNLEEHKEAISRQLSALS